MRHWFSLRLLPGEYASPEAIDWVLKAQDRMREVLDHAPNISIVPYTAALHAELYCLLKRK